MTGGPWIGLFSGGKDSAWAVHRARESGRDVRRLVTVHPPADSYLYHVPATRLAGLAAASMGIPLVEVEDIHGHDGLDSAERGDSELEPLEAAVADLDRDLDIAGVTAGAIESEYQRSRIQAMCGRLGIDLYAPLWGRDPLSLGRRMIDAGVEIVIIKVAAAGLDRSWLGRRLDADALRDLARLRDRYGVHPLGEGGEYETFVVDGPHMCRPIGLEYATEWEGAWGRLVIEDAWLE